MGHRVTADDRPVSIVSQQALDEASLAGNFVVYTKDAADQWNGIVIPWEEAKTHEEAALKRAAMTLPSLNSKLTMIVSGPVDGRGMALREITVRAVEFELRDGDPTYL